MLVTIHKYTIENDLTKKRKTERRKNSDTLFMLGNHPHLRGHIILSRNRDVLVKLDEVFLVQETSQCSGARFTKYLRINLGKTYDKM